MTSFLRTCPTVLAVMILLHPVGMQSQIPPALAHPAPGSLASIVTADSDRALVARVLRVQDVHAMGPTSLAIIRRALHSHVPAIRRIAVQAAGRLERTEFITDIATAMADPAAEVRVAAANAMAQAVSHSGVAAARIAITTQLGHERDASVRGMLAESLGRLPETSADQLTLNATALSGLIGTGDGSLAAPDAATLRGVARGLFFLTRARASRGAIPDSVRTRLRALVSYGRTAAATDTADDVRMFAAAALIAAGDTSKATIELILADADPFVREKAFAGVLLIEDTAWVRPVVLRALADPAAIVRYRALGVYMRMRLYLSDCGPLLRVVHDADESVALSAVDDLMSCRSDLRTGRLLDSLSTTLPGNGPNAHWQIAAHAIVSLAVVAPAQARNRLKTFATHGDFFVRTYAAMAARRLDDVATLYFLARDAHPNVRAAAIDGLSVAVGHDADSVYIDALESNDSQVLRSAALALRGSHDTRALLVLSAALDRVSAMRRETSRDGRAALLDRMKEFGGAPVAAALQPYLMDVDSVVASRAADDIEAWTGRRPRVAPRPLPPIAPPDFADLATLEQTHVTIEMDDGSTIPIELHPLDAPTNTARFVRLARAGYFNGLTFHRVVPFFVIQGGSPEANEYVGDSLFTRDEVGLENTRGSIGVSTRGHDTGDGQIYVNLVDNASLDHEYTVFATVIAGRDVLDRIQEGARIRRVIVRNP